MKMVNKSYKNFFKNKRITQVGLGLLGRGVGDAEFLAECGAELIVTDLKTEEQLRPSVERLKKFPNIKFSLGGHKMEDFSARGGQERPDFILKGAGVPIDSIYIAEARKNNIPIEMSTSLFVKLLPKNTKTIGITGTRGKSTTTMMIYEVLNRIKNKLRINGGRKSQVFLGGNVRDKATLPLLKEIDASPDVENFVVMELDSWQLQGFNDAKISPNVAVFTTFMSDHMNYYGSTTLTTGQAMERYFEDKANVFKYQKIDDVLIIGEQITRFDLVIQGRTLYECFPKRALVARAKDFPKDWTLNILGEHNKQNAMCAILALRALKVPEEIIKEGVENFSAVPGRLQFVKEISGVKIYNDNNSTTPEATIVALKAIGEELSPDFDLSKSRIPIEASGNKELRGEKRIVLIAGGADKGLELEEMVEAINKYCKAVVLLPGSGTEKLLANSYQLSALKKIRTDSLDKAVKEAFLCATRGDTILFSPGFASFGLFQNEYDRNDQFVKIVEGLVSNK